MVDLIGADDAYFVFFRMSAVHSKICKSNGHKVRICLNNTSGCRGLRFRKRQRNRIAPVLPRTARQSELSP